MSTEYDADRIRRGFRAIQFGRMLRLIHRRDNYRELDVDPASSRFSDPERNYGVLYAAENIRCSFWETVARNRFDRRKHRKLPRQDIESRLVVSLCSTEDLSLVDLRKDGPARLSAPTAVVHDTNHAAGRTLSAATYANVPEADGFIYPSRFTGHACVAVFDRAIVKLKVLEVTPLIECAGFFDMLDDYDIKLVD
ncbi:MAG: RES family NAD+ phosphorylase [Gammaproteobacteria bacterium]|nr:RES family NAD+ phosphorylase [Gammaproteobacteria bacterium]